MNVSLPQITQDRQVLSERLQAEGVEASPPGQGMGAAILDSTKRKWRSRNRRTEITFAPYRHVRLAVSRQSRRQ